MPESIQVKYTKNQPSLEHVSHALETEIRELAENLNLPIRVSFSVASVEEFVVKSLAHQYDNPLVEIESQVSGTIQVVDANAIRQLEQELRDAFTIVEGHWDGRLSEVRRLYCVIPPQTKPPGWDYSADLPHTFEMFIESGHVSLSSESNLVSFPSQQVESDAPSGVSDQDSVLVSSSKHFDVFLAHNSKDKDAIRKLSGALESRGMKPWLDEDQIAPGKSFQDAIQQAIQEVHSVAVCVGKDGLGKWQDLELKAAISRCVDAGIPVVPVLLPGVERLPNTLLFLSELNWVKFEHNTTEEAPILRLLWGISGTRPTELDRIEEIAGQPRATQEKRASLGQPGRSSGVVFGLHGIRTHAEWHRTLYEVLGLYAWQVRTERWTFGKFSIFKFLSPWARSAKVKWFREVYIDEIKDRRVQLSERDKPSIVAHSFGTYILGNAMLKYDWLRFDKVVLCGSILPIDFPWDKLIERGQVQTVRNEYGVNDVWVRVVRWFIPETGPSGYSGFICNHERLKQERFEFEHSEYFDYGHMEAKWLPFLQTQLEELPASDAAISQRKQSFPIGLYLIYTALLASVVLIILWIVSSSDALKRTNEVTSVKNGIKKESQVNAPFRQEPQSRTF